MNITGKITGIKYTITLRKELKEVDIAGLDINKTPAAFLLSDNKQTYAVSKWVSPKRTRTYPYERVYNTLQYVSKKITVIPIVKDEGTDGDRDYIQWDTVSLMSLLDVFVVFAYYDSAKINPRNKLKITSQQFDNEYVLGKIKEIERYHSSALHWNLNELSEIHLVVEKTKKAYSKIEKKTGVKLHNFEGLKNFANKIENDRASFMAFSRDKAEKAQAREIVTVQPKERLSTSSKAKITISNYLGGQYFFTVDETQYTKNKISLIERKHSKNSLLPSRGDIKDGLLKMILFSNLTDVKADGKLVKSKSVLCLTSSFLKGEVTSSHTKNEIDGFIVKNKFSTGQISLIKSIFEEARKNNFLVKVQFS
ncbi:MAG: hypothetical protein LBU65_17140 [Planctomycetaceae bacterium]|jgi:hypothetical protein|nr:hypothetical protein [Planctomycetaceae bacterium]